MLYKCVLVIDEDRFIYEQSPKWRRYDSKCPAGISCVLIRQMGLPSPCSYLKHWAGRTKNPLFRIIYSSTTQKPCKLEQYCKRFYISDIFLTMIIGCFVPIYEFMFFLNLIFFAFKHHNHCAYSFISLIYNSLPNKICPSFDSECHGIISHGLVSRMKFVTINSPTRVGLSWQSWRFERT